MPPKASSCAPRRRRRRDGDVNTIPRSTNSGVKQGIAQYGAKWTKPSTPTGPSVGTEIELVFPSSTQNSIATNETLPALTCDAATISCTHTLLDTFSSAGKPEDAQSLFLAAVDSDHLPPPTYAIPHDVSHVPGTVSTSAGLHGQYDPISPLMIDPDSSWPTIPQPFLLGPWSPLSLDHPSPTHAAVASPPSPYIQSDLLDPLALDTLFFSESSFPNHTDQQSSPLAEEFSSLNLLGLSTCSPLGHSPTPSISISLEPPDLSDIDAPSILSPSPQWPAGLMPVPDFYSPASSPGSTYSSARTPSDSSGPDSPTVHRSGSSTSSLAGAITGRSPREHPSKIWRHSPY